MNDTHLLAIDPQVDFCHPEGSLFVPGADEDMARLARLVEGLGDRLAAVHVTLDTHQRHDISHPGWWRDAEDRSPAPFTTLTATELEQGHWRTAVEGAHARSLEYLRKLEEGGRHPHVVWPEHCLVGSPGHAVDATLLGALHGWEAGGRRVDFVLKGNNPWTEHFSAFRAEVSDYRDPSTDWNVELVERLRGAERLLVTGEARSHCVAHSLRDLVTALNDPAAVKRLVLLTDTTSDVPGFEDEGIALLDEASRAGVRLATTTEIAAELGVTLAH
ncbi:MAG: hypothetical protein AAF533_05280 [Acidobacteriota bacterium]